MAQSSKHLAPASGERSDLIARNEATTRKTSETDNPLTTTKFTYVMTAEGHAVITGRDGTIQRCEDEPIHIPGAIQSFGLLVVLQETEDCKLIVRIASENAQQMIGYSPNELFGLESFADILSEEQAEILKDQIDFVRDEDTSVVESGPDLFTLSVVDPNGESRKFWCALHINWTHPDWLICEFEFENDLVNPHAPWDESTPEVPEDTLDSNPTAEEFLESTMNISKPLRVLRRARKAEGEAAALEVFNIVSQIQTQLAKAPSMDIFLKTLVGVVQGLTGFHRVMIYQFDKDFNGTVVTELVDPRATKDLYKGLHFPAFDIPKQARELYKINGVRLLYDRGQETARLVCRTPEDLNTPLDLTHSYLRAMSPIHVKYLENMAVRASMSISIIAFGELWGLISCHSYGQKGMRVSFSTRRLCRLIGETASRSIERLSYASRINARKLINTMPTKQNPSGYITASSGDLLTLFSADFGFLSIQGTTTMLGTVEGVQEACAMREYLKLRKFSAITTSQDVVADFPDLDFQPGFKVLAGLLLVPLSSGGDDFIVFFRKSQTKEVRWAGNPYEKAIQQGTQAHLEPRKSFRLWSEKVEGTCREWTEEDMETAAVLYLVYGKFIEVWRQKEAALESSHVTKLLLANSAHEVRTPLNAIINYLEIALEGSLDADTMDCLKMSHAASKSLIYVINDLLDLAKIEEGTNLRRTDVMNLEHTFLEATGAFSGDAKRKGIGYTVTIHPGLPKRVLGDQRTVRQSMTNLIANAITNTIEGGVTVEIYVSLVDDGVVHVEVAVQDSGVGMSAKQMDSLLAALEQVLPDQPISHIQQIMGEAPQSTPIDEGITVGLGLATVSRIVQNMSGQLRLRSAVGQGSRFVIQYPFEVVDSEESVVLSPASEELRLLSSNEAETEVLLVDRVKSLKPSRRGSSESQKSQVDRLIEAIQDPTRPIKTPEEPDVPTSAPSGHASDASRQLQESPLSTDNLHVLVAEDDPINSKILQKRLERAGHTVHLTKNGAECASAYEETERLFDVVLMDIQVRRFTHRESGTDARSDANTQRTWLDEDGPRDRSEAGNDPLPARAAQRASAHHRRIRLARRAGARGVHWRWVRRLAAQAHLVPAPQRAAQRHCGR
jgi:light-regulated signal transduction histidine kinase (bacteriophytochrome)